MLNVLLLLVSTVFSAAPPPPATMSWEVKGWLCYDGQSRDIAHKYYDRISVGGGSYGNVGGRGQCQTTCQNNVKCHMYWYNIMNGGPQTCWNWNVKSRRNLMAIGYTESEVEEINNMRRRMPSYRMGHQCWYKYGLQWTLDQWAVGARPKDCSDLRRNGETTSGYFTVYPDTSTVVVRANENVAIPMSGVRVYCSFENRGSEAWMLIGTFKDKAPDGTWAHGPYTYNTAPAPNDSTTGTTVRFPFRLWNDVMLGLGANGAIRITSTVYETQDPQYTYCRAFWKRCTIKDDSENYDNSCQESYGVYSNGTFSQQQFASVGKRKDGHGSITGYLGTRLLSGHVLTVTGFQGGHPALGRCRKSDLRYHNYEHNRGFMFWMGETVTGVSAALPACTANELTALPKECKCGSDDCAAGKWCYDGACQNAAKYPACPVNFQTQLTAECVCGSDTTTCAAKQWCYEGSCKTSAKCNVRPDVQKNLFYGAKVYGKWNATAKRMYMNFTTPWDVKVGKIAWKNADTTMQFLSTANGLWSVDKATDPCKHTYNLNVPQTTFFGSGSKFQITGSQLSTKLRVEATEVIKTVKNRQEYDYTRNIKNTVPVLVNLVTRTTISVRFRSTAAPPGPGPAPALEDFVLFIAAEDNFATADPHVLITMKVHSRTCVDHSLSDTGVRVKTGADNIKTGSVQNFDWTKDSNGTIIAPYEHNLCVEELKWKFVPKKYKDYTYEIELEFDLKNLPQKFTTIAAIDIKQADVLADVGFTSTISTYNDTNCTVATSKFILGSKFYTKIELTDLIIDADTISCETYKIKQTKGGSTAETDLKGEVKYAFVQRKHPTAKNTHICGAELESHHFHVSVDGYDTVLETEILITYNQTNTRRELISMPLNSGMWDDEVMNANEMEEFDMMMLDDEEVEVAAQFDETDKAFRNAKRAPDSDDMTCDLFIENEVAKNTAAVGNFMSQESTSMFFTMAFCFLVVGAFGFIFGFMRTKGSDSYKKIPDNSKASLLVELE